MSGVTPTEVSLACEGRVLCAYETFDVPTVGDNVQIADRSGDPRKYKVIRVERFYRLGYAGDLIVEASVILKPTTEP